VGYKATKAGIGCCQQVALIYQCMTAQRA
jgi:hypothetical protein